MAALVPYALYAGSAALPEVVSGGVAAAGELAELAATGYQVIKGVKRGGEYLYDKFSKKSKPMAIGRKPRGGRWGYVGRVRKIRSKNRRRYRKRYRRRGRRGGDTTTSRYKPYARKVVRSKRHHVSNIANVIEKATCLSNPTAKILIQQNTQIASAANQCGWEEFFGATSYGCNGYLGQCLARQYAAHTGELTRNNVNAMTQPMFIKSVHFNICIRDNIGGTSHLKLYICKCKKSYKAIDYGGDWPDMLTKGLSANYHNTFGTAASAINANMVSFSPFSLPGFGRFWKVVAEEDYYVESSQSVDINKSFLVNRFFTGKDLHEYDFFKGCSVMLLFKVVGDTDTADPWNLTAGGASICVNKTVYSKWDSGSGDRVYDGYGGSVPS